MIFRKASQISFVAASSVGKCPRVLMILRTRAWTLSRVFVTGMISAVPVVPAGVLAYGATIRDRGTGEHVRGQAGNRTMSCELELVVGRPCDPPGCAARANP